jgi:AcrR family transcriptional regulator
LNQSTSQPPERRKRLPYDVRRAQIIEKCIDYMVKHGVNVDTRSIAQACGVSQRLLYRYFPSKSALLKEVYSEVIEVPFDDYWLAALRDRSLPAEERMIRFYLSYEEEVLTNRWWRLFLSSSMEHGSMHTDFMNARIYDLLELLVAEAAQETGIDPPKDRALRYEIGWALHGNISHYSLRKHLYGVRTDRTPREVIGMYVRAFLMSFETIAKDGHAELTEHVWETGSN